MTNETINYERLADLLEYPGSDWDSKITACAGKDALTEFHSRVAALTLNDLHELYTRTFDLNPVCALEIGYHLFGENYKRGQFLASLRETEAPFDLGQEHQLPDYLPVLLRLLGVLDDEEARASLISECLIPALERMLKPLKDSDNPYRFLLEAARATLQSEVPVVLAEAPRFKMRASLPVLTDDPDLLSGSAARCAVVAPPHRDDSPQFNWGYAPENRGTAPDSKLVRPEGQRPSAYQATEPESQLRPQR